MCAYHVTSESCDIHVYALIVHSNKAYPDEEHVFFYNNAKTHTACWPDALSA